MDISDPMAPVAAGQAQDDGYTHDSHCRIYRGPDKAYKESEICFNANEDTVTIHDVSNKLLPVQLARVGYENASYTHQAWLTEDHTHILVADETDEQTHGINATTYIFNVKDLDKPKFVGKYVSHSTFIDHNNYIKGNLDYQAALTGGLRVLNLKKVAKGKLKEIAYFDVFRRAIYRSSTGAGASIRICRRGTSWLRAWARASSSFATALASFSPQKSALQCGCVSPKRG